MQRVKVTTHTPSLPEGLRTNVHECTLERACEIMVALALDISQHANRGLQLPQVGYSFGIEVIPALEIGTRMRVCNFIEGLAGREGSVISYSEGDKVHILLDGDVIPSSFEVYELETVTDAPKVEEVASP